MKKPTIFGKYLLLERVNVGGMAEVFIAKAFGVEGFERILAIKKILPTMAEDEEFITMFIDEARISVQLNHANVVHIHELGKHEDAYFIAMEYVAGRDVRTILERYRRRKEIMPTAQAVFIISKLCDGLDYAHRKKDARGQDLHIIHRDVSPQNVLISYEGEVKVIDFGIAKAANRSQKTQAGILKGKFGYMSPEQVRGMPIDRRSDIFAVGVLLYEMLTGEKLFVGESDFSTLEKVRNADVPLPREFNPNIPPGLEKVVLKALAREPEERYQWASDLAEDLMRFLLAGDAIYSSKHLSSFMKEAFAEDMLRESEKMERYAGIERPDQIETSGVTVPPPAPPRPSSQVSKRVPPPAVVVTGSPAGRAPTAPAAPAPGYIPPPTAEELAEMDGGGADKTQIVDSTQTFRAPETRIADSSVVVDDSITGRSENPIQTGSGGTASAFNYRDPPPEPGPKKGKSGPKAQVVISSDDGEAYAGATMIGPAPTAPPSRSRSEQEHEEEATGDIPVPVAGRSSRAQPRAQPPRQAKPAYDEPQDDALSGRDGPDDYADEDARRNDEQDYQQEEEVTGSVPVAPPVAAKKGAKPVPAPKAKVKAKVPAKGKPFVAKNLPKPVLFAAAAGIVLVLVAIGVVALSPPSAGEVTFMVSPANGARIEVNGEEVQPNTLLSLAPGQYRVVATAPGHQRKEKLVEVAAGKREGVSLMLEPMAEQPAGGQQPEPGTRPGAGQVTVAPGKTEPGTQQPGAGKDPENTPPSGTTVSPGNTEPGAGEPAGTVAQKPREPEKTPEPETAPEPETPPEPKKVAAIFEGDEEAEIVVNGKRLGRTPEARMAGLEVGKTYRFTAKRAGYKTYEGRFTADGSRDEMKVAFELTKEPEQIVREPAPRPTPRPTPPPPTPKVKPGKVMGKFACSTKPAGADILVDGKKTGRQTPVPLSSPLMLPVGNRKVSFKLNGKTTKPVVVAITEDGVAKLLNVPIE
ncbi:serine/threonine-protein kinase [Pyxidicoccus xibeiensis]|uniref:serine/threonine-protein kinase n=1 Tax=Pyxidicoccus xibeiensis TaxID=2906759 RepID=UPI0020A751E0|nr:serine/threonine-protein kinase [Pyxidicoccus xibeiensis]MCP3145155.1 protein kinase [Pyxidicoccus xibeiensis]